MRKNGLKSGPGDLRRLLDHTEEIVLLLDAGGVVLEANGRAARYLGTPEGGAAGRDFFSLCSAEKAKARRAFFEDAVAKGSPVSFEEEREGRWLVNRLVPFGGEEGGVGAVALYIRDVTDMKGAEERAKLQERQVARAARMVSLGTLVSGVAHEINNPNNFIMMNTPILLDVWRSAEPLLDKASRELGDFDLGGLPFTEMRENVPVLFSGIAEGARRIDRIVSSLKNYARSDGAERIEEVDLNAVVGSAVGLLGHFIGKSTDRFECDLAESLPTIEGSAQKLEQVVINLVQNACQSLPSKDRAVRVATAAGGRGDAVVLTVGDEGRGMSADVLGRIMDPFFTTRRGEGGTGLGLSVSADIVRDHGGRLTVSSREGEGTVFSVTLPLKTELLRTRVLVVDDEEPLRKVMTKILDRQGLYTVREAANGLEACIKLGTFRPRLLVMDINMPEMDGREVCRWILSEPALADTKVIIVTGYPDSRLLAEIREMGFAHVLTKPFLATDFAEAVRRVLAD